MSQTGGSSSIPTTAELALPFQLLAVAFERSGLRKHPDVGLLSCLRRSTGRVRQVQKLVNLT
jgi:hypothetical protein